MDILIDVLIAVFNGEKTVKASIESIQAQTIKNIRILVVDDGSTDNTLQLLNDIASRDPRLLILPKPHSGIVESLNFGLSHCEAEFLARFDADDIAYPHRFETQIEFLKQNPDCLAVASSAIHIDEHDNPLGTKASFTGVLARTDASWVPCREPYLLQPFLMLRRSSIERVNGYRFCDLAEDSDLYWRLLEIGKLKNTEDILGAYRMNPNSVTSKSIINGRRLAFCSELIGISALRRRNGLPDISFSKERINRYSKAISLEEFCKLGGGDLTDDEFKRLCASSSAKLMDLTSYRPYELDEHDCRFIKNSINNYQKSISNSNWSELESKLIATSHRLLGKRKFKELFLISSPKIFLKLLYRGLVPDCIRINNKKSA